MIVRPAGVTGTLPVIFYIHGAGWVFDDAHTFERLQAGDVDIVQEPTEQPYGSRDCAIRDPVGNLIRSSQL